MYDDLPALLPEERTFDLNINIDAVLAREQKKALQYAQAYEIFSKKILEVLRIAKLTIGETERAKDILKKLLYVFRVEDREVNAIVGNLVYDLINEL